MPKIVRTYFKCDKCNTQEQEGNAKFYVLMFKDKEYYLCETCKNALESFLNHSDYIVTPKPD